MRLVEKLSALLKAFGCNGRGGVAVTFALTLPVLLALAGAASDFAVMTKLRSELQKAADASASAAAHEIPLAHKNINSVKSAAKYYASFALDDGSQTGQASSKLPANVSVTADVVENFSAVHVTITENWTPFFAHFVIKGVTPVVVSATARYVGTNNICVLGLGNNAQGVFLDVSSRLTGNNCGAFSNSVATDSLAVNSGASLDTMINCAAGGTNISGGATVSPSAVSDCPAVADPLANRPPPPVGGCDYNDVQIKGTTVTTLSPGVYCNGIKIGGNAQVTLGAGIYVMKNGGLSVTGSAALTGNSAGIFITGDDPQPLLFGGSSHISMTAPLDGPMAGLLVYEDRALTHHLTHQITSADARRLIGTIYLPVGDLLIDSGQTVADQSAYTAIIVNHLMLKSGPNLVLNSDYAATNVPMPAGIKGVHQIILTQ